MENPVTTACLAVSAAAARAAPALHRFVRDVRAARADAMALSAELHALGGVLALLRDDDDITGAGDLSLPPDLAQHTPAVISACGLLVGSLEGVLAGDNPPADKASLSLRWPAMRKHVVDLRLGLEAYRLALGLALDLVSLTSDPGLPHTEISLVLAEISHLRLRVGAAVNSAAASVLQNYLNVLQRHASAVLDSSGHHQEAYPHDAFVAAPAAAANRPLARAKPESTKLESAEPEPTKLQTPAAIVSPRLFVVLKSPDSAVDMGHEVLPTVLEVDSRPSSPPPSELPAAWLDLDEGQETDTELAEEEEDNMERNVPSTQIDVDVKEDTVEENKEGTEKSIKRPVESDEQQANTNSPPMIVVEESAASPMPDIVIDSAEADEDDSSDAVTQVITKTITETITETAPDSAEKVVKSETTEIISLIRPETVADIETADSTMGSIHAASRPARLRLSLPIEEIDHLVAELRIQPPNRAPTPPPRAARRLSQHRHQRTGSAATDETDTAPPPISRHGRGQLLARSLTAESGSGSSQTTVQSRKSLDRPESRDSLRLSPGISNTTVRSAAGSGSAPSVASAPSMATSAGRSGNGSGSAAGSVIGSVIGSATGSAGSAGGSGSASGSGSGSVGGRFGRFFFRKKASGSATPTSPTTPTMPVTPTLPTSPTSPTSPSWLAVPGGMAGVRSSSRLSTLRMMSPWRVEAEDDDDEEEGPVAGESAVFGVSLRRSIKVAGTSARTRHAGSRGASVRKFPLCVFACYQFLVDTGALETPDLFGRGDGASEAETAYDTDCEEQDRLAPRVRRLRALFAVAPDYGASVEIEALGFGPHDAAGLMLYFLGHLRRPLVGEPVLRRWVALSRQAMQTGGAGRSRPDEGLDFWTEALEGVSAGPALNLLKLLLNLWGDVAEVADRNDMTAERLAACVLRPLVHTRLADGRNRTDYVLALAFVIRRRSEYAQLLRGSGRKSKAAFEA